MILVFGILLSVIIVVFEKFLSFLNRNRVSDIEFKQNENQFHAGISLVEQYLKQQKPSTLNDEKSQINMILNEIDAYLNEDLSRNEEPNIA